MLTMCMIKKVIDQLGDQIFSMKTEGKSGELKAFVKGTAMQVKVWRALLEIPKGQMMTYSQVAERIENPRAARAVGTAIGQECDWRI